MRPPSDTSGSAETPRGGTGPVEPTQQRFAAVLWCANLQFFVVQGLVAARFRGGYSWSSDLISDLGNTRCGRYAGRSVCSPWHGVMDASFVLLGLTMLAGAALTGIGRRHGQRIRFGCVAIGLSGIGVVLVGAFPENVLPAAHGSGAVATFVFGNLGLIVLSGCFTSSPWWRVAAVASGVAALLALVVPLHLGDGAAERITAYPQTVWTATWGVMTLAARNRAGAPAPVGASAT